MATSVVIEQRSLVELETVIERGLDTFLDVGKALREIRDGRLYKKNYASFEEYCRTRWGKSLRSANDYIQAATFAESERNSANFSSINQALTEARGSNDVHFSSKSSEWYTPPEIIERTTRTLGRIDLDPCSPAEPTIPAASTFTKDDNGLRFDWCGNVYMNPPYGREIGEWVTKLLAEHSAGRTKEAIALVPARVDTDWFRQFRDFAVCFIDGRLKFSDHKDSAPFPSAVIYLGPNLVTFKDSFEDIGDVWVRFRG